MKEKPVGNMLDDIRRALNKMCEGYIQDDITDESIENIQKHAETYIGIIKNKNGIQDGKVKITRATWKQLYPKLFPRIMAKIGLNILKLPTRTIYLKWYIVLFPYKINVPTIYSNDLEDDDIIDPPVSFLMQHPKNVLNMDTYIQPVKSLEVIDLKFEIKTDTTKVF